MLFVPINAMDKIKESYDKGEKIYLKFIKNYFEIADVWIVSDNSKNRLISVSKEECINKLKEAGIEFEEVEDGNDNN